MLGQAGKPRVAMATGPDVPPALALSGLWLGRSLGCECLSGREKPPNFQTFLLARRPMQGAATGFGSAEARVFVDRPPGKEEGPRQGNQHHAKSVPGSKWVLGNGKSMGRKPPPRKQCEPWPHSPYVKIDEAQGPGRAESSVVFCADDSAGEFSLELSLGEALWC